MTQQELWTGIYVLSLVGTLIAIVLISRTTHKLARNPDQTWLIYLLRTFPVAELSILLIAAMYRSWDQTLGIAIGASLSNMVVVSAMSIERARPTGYATPPMYAAAVFCLVPIGFGVWTIVATPRKSELLILYTAEFQLLVSYAIAVPLWRTEATAWMLSVDTASSEQEGTRSVAIANPEHSSTQQVAHCDVQSSHAASPRMAQSTESSANDLEQGDSPDSNHDLETQPLLAVPPEPKADIAKRWHSRSPLLITPAVLLLCSAGTSFAIHALAARLRIADGQPGLLAGFVLSISPSLHEIRAMAFSHSGEENVTELKTRCSNNLILLALSLLIVGTGFGWPCISDTASLMYPPMLAALIPAVWHHLRGHWWLLGVPVLLVSFVSLGFWTLLGLAFGGGRDTLTAR